MAAEIELKLELSPEAVKELLASEFLGEPEDVLSQHSTYFDTADHQLFKAGFTLRIRRTGEALMQTVKATGSSASLFARSEWETPLTANTPQLDHSSPLQTEFGPDLDVAPQFDVQVDRRVWNPSENGSQIEVVVDQGTVISGERRTPICEVELELKDGDRQNLFVLARRIEAVAPVRFGVQSKAGRGYQLIGPQQFMFKAEPIELDRNMNTVRSFQTIAQSCFRQFRLNEDVLLCRRNAEALHQSRVALRRLRSAFSLYKPLLADAEAERLKDELRWLAGTLGDARNLDVLLVKAKDDDMHDRLKSARNAAYDDFVDALQSSRARSLMLDFNEWLHCGEYLDRPETADDRNGTAVDFACQALDRMRKKLKKHGRALAQVDDEQRHEARKDAKKLRYAAEFFGSLFPDKRGLRRHKRFISAMGDLQDHLGALNDLATGPSVLKKHGLEDHPAASSVISHADKQDLIDAAQPALDDVVDAKRFWR
ncbi:CHAD domain-containing protein [Rhizobium gallicum]|uniref:CYTH and CHAD domain-containing protein n=1 Tax=Rhizobium gallicum TaxID=56730 RepID=UPI001EF7F2AE|nr:CHAD domain-containing protein [Rhizobium gallicum]ULJ72297.1 CHAD domain-containing protein [Rhizobium gallicum]